MTDYININPGGKKMILSLDGGGMRGMISIAMLAELEKLTGKPCHELFDMVVGTSTGAIIATGIALKITAQEILEVVYKDKLPNAFPPDNLMLWIRYVLRGFRHIYPIESFNEALSHYTVGKKMRDIEDIILLMTTKDVRTGNTYFIVNKGPGAPAFIDWPLAGAVGASGAAPIYFPPVADNLIDGGVGVDANPCLAAAVEAMEYIGASEGFTDGNVILMSLGTGYIPNEYADGAASKFWLKDWVQYLIIEALDDTALQQALSTRAIYRTRLDFRRYNPALTAQGVASLGIDMQGRPALDTLSLDSRHPAQIQLMEDIGRTYAQQLDWTRAEIMPWDTVGGHQKPDIFANTDWSKTIFKLGGSR